MCESNFGKCLLTFAAGAAIGATLGVLFAPDKGVKTRRKIAKATNDLKDDVVEKLHDLVESAEEFVEELREEADELLNGEDKTTKARAK